MSVPSQHPDLIKHIDSNPQMINYHVLTSPVYLGPYHQFDSMSSNHNHVCNTPMASFQGASYQADGSRSSYFSSPMTHVDYPSQTDGTMITTPSADVVCGTTSLSQEKVSMDYHDSYVSSSPVHANVSATASYIYTNDHLQFDSQSTSVQSGSLHSTSTNRMYEFTQPMKIAAENGLQLATGRPKEKLIQMFDELQKVLNEQFKEMHDNIAQFMKMHEAEKHKANQLQKNIISENNDNYYNWF